MALRKVFEFHTSSTADLPAVVKELTKLFSERTILLLEGPVGAGKTELVKRLTQTLGLPETASPSFAIHHRYESTQAPVVSAGHELPTAMDHVDLYRVESEDDLESTGFWDLFGAERGLIVIEWSDRLNFDVLPLHWKKIQIEIALVTNPNHRKIKITAL